MEAAIACAKLPRSFGLSFSHLYVSACCKALGLLYQMHSEA